MKKKIAFILFVSWILYPFSPAPACVNGIDEYFWNNVHISRNNFPIPEGHPIHTQDPEWQEASDRIRQAYGKGSIEADIDFGVFLIYDKQYKKAEMVFEKLSQTHANDYKVAANFGTILEVNGKNEDALKWIKKAIEIDPNSHGGSEWIHAAILEAKIRGDNPISGEKLTGYSFGSDNVPKSSLSITKLKKLQEQLFYQLNERVTFIPPKDPYIAALLCELGNVTLALNQKKKAITLYEKAKSYGFDDRVWEKRIQITLSKVEIPAPPMEELLSPVEPQPAMDSLAKDHLSSIIPDVTTAGGENDPRMPWLWLGIGAALSIVGGLYWVKKYRGRRK